MKSEPTVVVRTPPVLAPAQELKFMSQPHPAVLVALADALKQTPRQVEQLVAERQARFGGLLTVDGACRSIAQERKVDLSALVTQTPALVSIAVARPVSSLKAGERATIEARVTGVAAPKEFNSKGRAGKLQKIELADETASTTLVLWNTEVDSFASLKIARGDCVRVTLALVKTTYDGKGVELHAQVETHVEKIDNLARFPTPDKGAVRLADLRPGKTSDVLARVLEAGELREFSTGGRTGTLCRVLLADASGQVWAVGWDAGAQNLFALRPGDAVLIENASVKNARTGDGLEIHANSSTRVVANPQNESIATREVLLEKAFSHKPLTELFELRDGSAALVKATLVKVISFEKTDTKQLPIARFTICDPAIPAKTFAGVAFGLNARFLESRNGSGGSSLEGKPFCAVLDAKTNTFAGGREAVVRHWLSIG